MIPGRHITQALDGFSPRHRPIFIEALRTVSNGDIAQAGFAIGAKCAEMNLKEFPNPYPVGDDRRAQWAEGFRRGQGDEYLEGPPPQPPLVPDFSKMKKPEINDWAAANLQDAVNQRLKKKDMIAEVTRLAIENGFRAA